jgi:hypothetical protein
MKRSSLPTWKELAVGLALAACSQDQIPTPQRSLDRPTDLAVACVQGPASVDFDTPTRMAVPPGLCDQNMSGTSQLRTLGFIPNSGTGEVAVAALSEGTSGFAALLDLDSRLPGFNFLPVGRLPVAAQTTSDGCRVIVADEGSCDLASIDVALVANGADLKTELPGSVVRLPLSTPAGRLLARPRTLELAPAPGVPLGQAASCSPDTPYHAWVAFPGCDLVAEFDLTSGAYLRGVFVHPDGPVDAGPAPSCPAECTDQLPAGTPPSGPPGVDGGSGPDAAASDGGGGVGGTSAPVDPYTRPVALALLVAADLTTPAVARTLFIGGATSRFIVAVDLAAGAAGFTGMRRLELDSCTPPAIPPPLNPLPSCDPVGVNRLRLGTGKTTGTFLYAATLDQTVRIVDAQAFRECETQADPQIALARFGDMPPPQYKSCLPIDEQTQPLLRRSNAVGPGVRTGGAPIDIGFATVLSQATRGNPEILNGTFAYVVTSNGTVVAINLDPDNTDAANATAIHQVHNRSAVLSASPTSDPSTGPPRVDPSSMRIAFPTTIGSDPKDLPLLAAVARECPGIQALPDLAIHFPDSLPVRFENWTVGYETALPDLLRIGNLAADTTDTLILLDPGGRFCGRDAEPGDYVVYGTCQDDTQCPTGEACFGAIGGHAGVCLASTPGAGGLPVAPGACLDLVSSRHEFRVQSTFNNTLVLDEKPLTIPRATGCTSDADCTDMDLIPGLNQRLLPGTKFRCDPVVWPGTTVRQCVATCDPPNQQDTTGNWVPRDDECRPDTVVGNNPTYSGLYNEYSGYVCGHAALDPSNPSGPRRCVASRVPRSGPSYSIDPNAGTNVANDCFVLPLTYEVHAGLTFTIIGDRSGFLHSRNTAADGTCFNDVSRGYKRVGRLSYNDPICTTPADWTPDHPDKDTYEVGDPILNDMGEQVDCGWDTKDHPKPLVSPNPCLRRLQPVVGPTGLNLILVWNVQTPVFEAAIGPAARLLDANGTIGPPAFGTAYSFTFTINGGFVPSAVTTNAFLPATLHGQTTPYGIMFPGPPGAAGWLYIIDQGDQISTISRGVLQGQMLRMDAQGLGIDIHTVVQ